MWAINRLSKRKNKLSAVYLLPNLVTLGAMFCGFYSIVSGINGLYIQSAIFILIAMILDGLDGRVARLTNTQTSFGEHFDSLSDLLCFGIAPALLIYLFSFSSLIFGYLAKLSYIACFVFIASAAIRLARFNSRNQSTDKKYFVGLASPAAACLTGCAIWVWSEFVGGPVSMGAALAIASTLVMTGLLMVSNFLYYSPKQVKLKDRVPFITLVLVIFTFSIILLEPSLVLLTIGITYALSGPFVYLWKKSKIQG